MIRSLSSFRILLAAAGLTLLSLPALAQSEKPNIVVIWGDDVGWYNIVVYNLGVKGYEMPIIDTDFPPRQKPGSFSLSQVMDKLTDTPSN